MWANAQRDGRPAEYKWRRLLNAAVWLTPTTRVPCSNAAKTRNPFKFAGVPQTSQSISAVSGPKFTILWRHLQEILLLNKFFPTVNTCLSGEDIAQQSCAMVLSRVQDISDLYSKFALRPHHVSKYGKHDVCDR